MNRLNSQIHLLQIPKNAKPQARRALLESASDDLIKSTVECAINTLNGNHKLNKGEKSEMKKYKNRSRALVHPKFSSKSKRKLLVQIAEIIVPLLTSILSGVIGALINNSH
jgi:hypothetical protein